MQFGECCRELMGSVLHGYVVATRGRYGSGFWNCFLQRES